MKNKAPQHIDENPIFFASLEGYVKCMRHLWQYRKGSRNKKRRWISDRLLDVFESRAIPVRLLTRLLRAAGEGGAPAADGAAEELAAGPGPAGLAPPHGQVHRLHRSLPGVRGHHPPAVEPLLGVHR